MTTKTTKETKTKTSSATAENKSAAESPTSPNLKKTTAKASANKTVTAKESAAISVDSAALSIEKSLKKKKKQSGKVIRDSFSFPEIDYLKILQVKALCLAEGVHVKKGEVLRAGLHLLMQMNKEELKQAIGKVERVKTGRPVNSKS